MSLALTIPRGQTLDDLCLHDFVANYDLFKKDSDGKRVYRKLTKVDHPVPIRLI